jgi:hypothetical protein
MRRASEQKVILEHLLMYLLVRFTGLDVTDHVVDCVFRSYR